MNLVMNAAAAGGGGSPRACLGKLAAAAQNSQQPPRSGATDAAVAFSASGQRPATASAAVTGGGGLQEDEGTRKSGPVFAQQAGFNSKSKSYYAALSDRAIELFDSEKALRKKKNSRHIVDLSRCFNISIQNIPKSKWLCVCVAMPDETLLIRAASTTQQHKTVGPDNAETTDWYRSILSAAIAARALRFGRPVVVNEFFECVWDVVVMGQPRLKKPVPCPDGSPNICVKVPELAGPRRLCFYPHTIILAKLGIEPAVSALSNSGLPVFPPFRSTDFAEFSRQFINQFGFQEKFFIMRIGRSALMGQCEIWVQCESEEVAAEVHAKLTDIIQRETEKKHNALKVLGATIGGGHNGSSTGLESRHHSHGSNRSSSGVGGGETSSSSPSTASSSTAATEGGGASSSSPAHRKRSPPPLSSSSLTRGAQQQQQGSLGAGSSNSGGGGHTAHDVIATLEPIAEMPVSSSDVQHTSSVVGSRTAACCGGNGGEFDVPKELPKRHTRLSASAREKRSELRECRARVESLEEESQHLRELFLKHQQKMLMQGKKQQLQQQPSASLEMHLFSAATSEGGMNKNSPTAGCGAGCPGGRLLKKNSVDRCIPAPTCLENHLRKISTRSLSSSSHTTPTENDVSSESASPTLSLETSRRHTAAGSGVKTAADVTIAKTKALDREQIRQLNAMCPPRSMLANFSGIFEPLNNAGGRGRAQHLASSATMPSSPMNAAETAAANDEETEDSGGTLRLLSNSRSASTLNLIAVGHPYLMEALVDVHIHHTSGGSSMEDQEGSGQTLVGAEGCITRFANSPKSAASNSPKAKAQTETTSNSSGKATAASSSNAKKESDEEKPEIDGSREQPPADEGDCNEEYVQMLMQEQQQMDRVSCSSDSFSSNNHLAIPSLHWEAGAQQNVELCSCASDSGDSCYSSMAAGPQLMNPRGLSFSSDIGRRPSPILASPSLSHHSHQQQQQTASSTIANACNHQQQQQQQNLPSNNNNAQRQLPHGSATSTTMGGRQPFPLMAFASASGGGGGPSSSSSSSRFSIEASLITTLEEEERSGAGGVFVDDDGFDEDGQTSTTSSITAASRRGRGAGAYLQMQLRQQQQQQEAEEDLAADLRKRAFSLGSRSWITKPFRRLANSTSGTGIRSHLQDALLHSSQNQQQQQQHYDQQPHSASSTTSFYEEECQLLPHSPSPHHSSNNSSGTGAPNESRRLSASSRQASTSSVVSSSCGGGHQTRSGSVSSSHSMSLFTNTGTYGGMGSTTAPSTTSSSSHSMLTQRLRSRRHREPTAASDEQLDDLVEMEFIPRHSNNGCSTHFPGSTAAVFPGSQQHYFHHNFPNSHHHHHSATEHPPPWSTRRPQQQQQQSLRNRAGRLANTGTRNSICAGELTVDVSGAGGQQTDGSSPSDAHEYLPMCSPAHRKLSGSTNGNGAGMCATLRTTMSARLGSGASPSSYSLGSATYRGGGCCGGVDFCSGAACCAAEMGEDGEFGFVRPSESFIRSHIAASATSSHGLLYTTGKPPHPQQLSPSTPPILLAGSGSVPGGLLALGSAAGGAAKPGKQMRRGPITASAAATPRSRLSSATSATGLSVRSVGGACPPPSAVLQEVCCFIAPSELDRLAQMTQMTAATAGAGGRAGASASSANGLVRKKSNASTAGVGGVDSSERPHAMPPTADGNENDETGGGTNGTIYVAIPEETAAHQQQN